jgi:hypothetical protein
MMVTEENKYWEKKGCSSASFFILDSAWTCLGPNPGLEGDHETSKCAL